MRDQNFPQDPSQDPERRWRLPDLRDRAKPQLQPTPVPESLVGHDDPEDQPGTDEPPEAA